MLQPDARDISPRAHAAAAGRGLRKALCLMRFSAEIWHVLGAIGAAMILSWLVVVSADWPPELNLVFNSLFYWSLFSLFLAISLTTFLYLGRVGRTRHLRAFFSALLVALSAIVYLGFEEVASNTSRWQELLAREHPGTIAVLQMTVSYAKTILAFGIAAFGANLLAGVVPHPRAEALRLQRKVRCNRPAAEPERSPGIEPDESDC